MRAVTGEITSSRPISLSKAAAVLSRFAASETGARPDVAAYLRRAVTAFEELVSVHQKIRVHRELSPLEDDSRRKKKKQQQKKGMYCDGDEAAEDYILERQAERDISGRNRVEGLGVSLDGRIASAMLEADGTVEVKKKWEVGKRTIVGIVEETNGAVGKKKKVKEDQKKEVEEKRKDEAITEERSEVRRRKKEKKRKVGRTEEDGRVDFDLENMDRKRKKRKHLDADQGGAHGEMEQHEEEKKKKRRTVD